MSTHQQPPSQPDDFPGLDLEAWREALPMPDPVPAPKSPTPNLDRIVNEVFAGLPQDVHDAIDRLAETPPKRGIRRRKEKP